MNSGNAQTPSFEQRVEQNASDMPPGNPGKRPVKRARTSRIPGPDGDSFATPNSHTPIDAAFLNASFNVSRSGSRQNSLKEKEARSAAREKAAATKASGTAYMRGKPYWKATRVQKGTVDKPWMKKREPRELWVTVIPLFGMLVGAIIGGFLIWDGIRQVAVHRYCPVLNEEFSSGFNTDIWQKEVEVGGFG